jgi:hypothetical protein
MTRRQRRLSLYLTWCTAVTLIMLGATAYASDDALNQMLNSPVSEIKGHQGSIESLVYMVEGFMGIVTYMAKRSLMTFIGFPVLMIMTYALFTVI